MRFPENTKNLAMLKYQNKIFRKNHCKHGGSLIQIKSFSVYNCKPKVFLRLNVRKKSIRIKELRVCRNSILLLCLERIVKIKRDHENVEIIKRDHEHVVIISQN